MCGGRFVSLSSSLGCWVCARGSRSVMGGSDIEAMDVDVDERLEDGWDLGCSGRRVVYWLSVV